MKNVYVADPYVPQEAVSSEKNLLIALLDQTYRDLKGLAEEPDVESAVRWVLSSLETEWSFKWVCSHLKLHSTTIEVFVSLAKESDYSNT